VAELKAITPLVAEYTTWP